MPRSAGSLFAAVALSVGLLGTAQAEERPDASSDSQGLWGLLTSATNALVKGADGFNGYRAGLRAAWSITGVGTRCSDGRYIGINEDCADYVDVEPLREFAEDESSTDVDLDSDRDDEPDVDAD